MKWTTEPPKEAGWYWIRRKGCYPGVVALISYAELATTEYRTSLVIWDGRSPELLPDDAEWAGPIPKPEDPK